MSKIVRGPESLPAASAPAKASPAQASEGQRTASDGVRMHRGRLPTGDVGEIRGTAPHAEYASSEHMLLGNEATGNEVLTELRFKDGTTLTFGEIVALSGDFITSVAELRQLAATEEGQAEIRWVRWLSLGQKNEPEPKIPAEAKKRALLRYAGLAADNTTHFSHGGTAIQTYEQRHTEALRKAHEAGRTGNDALFAAAVTDEACAQHFLSDAFASGHVRAPVIDIRETYRREMPDSIKQILKYAIRHMIKTLDARGDVPWHWPRGMVEGKAMDAIKKAAGSVLDAFTLGDLVALACHNADGNGLHVISDVHYSGLPVPGGYHWHAKGDGQLTPSSIGWRMAVSAMRISRIELDLARAAGVKSPQEPLAPTFAATRFIPRDDVDKNPVLTWRWGSMNKHMVDAMNTALKESLVAQLRRYAPNPPVVRFNNWGKMDPNGSVHLHVGEAFEAFCRELETDGIQVVERAVKRIAADFT